MFRASLRKYIRIGIERWRIGFFFQIVLTFLHWFGHVHANIRAIRWNANTKHWPKCFKCSRINIIIGKKSEFHSISEWIEIEFTLDCIIFASFVSVEINGKMKSTWKNQWNQYLWTHRLHRLHSWDLETKTFI